MQKFFIILMVFYSAVFCEATVTERFPKPQFESPYVQPQTTTPTPRSLILEYLDIFVLITALGITSYLALKSRSRRAIFSVMIFSLLYFGFWRKGCVCPVGSLQNVALTLFDSTYFIPLPILLFFILPILFTLFFGRIFCAAVCPLGSIQELVILKPIKLPHWLSHALGLLPYIYLAFAVLFAATGAAFIICRYDPFVGFFRFDAHFKMIMLGICILFIGVFIARPYCRFICPYGILLNWMSTFSWRHVTITPDKCIQCRLCEESCPFDAINVPTTNSILPDRTKSRRRLGFIILLIPVVIAVSAWLGAQTHIVYSRVHPTVRLAQRIKLEESGRVSDTTLESRSFRSSGKTLEQLFNEASMVQNRIKYGTALAFAFIAFVVMIKLFHLSIFHKKVDYEPDRGLCLSCGRCFRSCPQEHVRLGLKIQDQ